MRKLMRGRLGKNLNSLIDSSYVRITGFVVGFCHADEGGICLTKRHYLTCWRKYAAWLLGMAYLCFINRNYYNKAQVRLAAKPTLHTCASIREGGMCSTKRHYLTCWRKYAAWLLCMGYLCFIKRNYYNKAQVSFAAKPTLHTCASIRTRKTKFCNAFKLFIAISIILFCNSIAQAQNTNDANYIHRAIKKVTDVMVHDIYSPPVASRTYAYITVAGYETIIHANNNYISLAGQLHGLTSTPQPEEGKQYNYTLAAVQAILTTAKSFVISEDTIQSFRKSMLQEFKNNGVKDDVFNNSVEYGQKVAAHILAWAANDNYKQVRSLPQYTVTDDDATWKPTPPAYIKAIEPNWNKIRTWVLDSAEQFKPAPATNFSSNKNSDFYKNAMDVYNVGLHLTEEQKAIANFWDCNPFKMNVRGHVMFATKKISPGGHWINITHVACKKQPADAVQSLEAYACVAITLADAFISCWDEKYRSKVVRPETFINQFIDNDWMPLLQTPPFPEYTSGHSVVSAACAVILSKMFGDNFAFTDSTEFEFDLPPRSFTSFKQAAQEAAISRFYGGIHYMPSINNGFDEGEKIAAFISSKIKTRKTDSAKNN